MADFCSLCIEDMGSKKADIDIEDIFKELDSRMFQHVLCEGCALGGIAKDENGNMFLANVRDGKWMTKEEYINNYKSHI